MGRDFENWGNVSRFSRIKAFVPEITFLVGWECTPWHATQRAALEALKKSETS